MSSLPVPVSPWMRTAQSVAATALTSSRMAASFGLDPISSEVATVTSFSTAGNRARDPIGSGVAIQVTSTWRATEREYLNPIRRDTLIGGACRLDFSVEELLGPRRGGERDAAGDDQCDGRARAWSGVDCESAADARCALTHATQPEVPVLPLLEDRRIDADAIVPDAQRQIARVLEQDVHRPGRRVPARIANRFVSNAVDLVPHHRMQIAAIAHDG